MKIAIIGAAGLRTPLMIQNIALRQQQLDLDELALMDIDADALDLMKSFVQSTPQAQSLDFRVSWTTDPVTALTGADYVITTFRVGGIASRVIDERVPLELGILGQETTGPGGFAMGLRTIPVLIEYLETMRRVCPDAWLVNFANPSGMLTEAVFKAACWERVVGICDAPSSMHSVAAKRFGIEPGEVDPDYFGLNHLGWVRRVRVAGKDVLPQFIDQAVQAGGLPELPFSADLLASLQMIPNEYLFYYYSARQAVQNILAQETTRGEYLAGLNKQFFSQLSVLRQNRRLDQAPDLYRSYLDQRSHGYMVNETGRGHGRLTVEDLHSLETEGYAGVALDLIEALEGRAPKRMILNVRSQGAVAGMGFLDVVEIPVKIYKDAIIPIEVGSVPEHCLGLMKQIKAYEHWTIEAALERSYRKALHALTIHPLVADETAARRILEGYRARHGSYFPNLD